MHLFPVAFRAASISKTQQGDQVCHEHKVNKNIHARSKGATCNARNRCIMVHGALCGLNFVMQAKLLQLLV